MASNLFESCTGADSLPCCVCALSAASRHQALPTSDPDEVDSNRLALLSDRGDISQRRSNSSGNLPAKDDLH
jgi:hypothetical protein